MRVLGRVRLSRLTEESTSVERQREIIEQWASQNDHEVVGWAEDLDVSGSVDPFDTPSLGPWLARDKLGEWDILCAWKLDRVARRAVPLHRVFGLCQDEGKLLVCVSDNIDLSHWVGRLVASVIAGVAEGELEAIRERNRASAQKLREVGRWGGGKPFYGYRAAPREDAAGWELVPDEHASAVLISIINRVLDGESTESIATSLNAAGELSPNNYIRQRAGKPIRGDRWHNAALRTLLRSKTLLGHTTHNGSTVRDDEGIPIRKGPELIPQDVFDRLQACLEGFKQTNRSAGASPLLGVAICGVCSRLLHHRSHRPKRGTRVYHYRHYRCSHDGNTIQADDLESLVEQTFIETLGDQKVQERVFVPAESHQVELDEAVRAVEEITPLLGTLTSTTMRSRLLGQLEALDKRIAQLETMPSADARWELQEADQTYAEAWESTDSEGRRHLLLKSGITVTATGIGKALEFGFNIPDDVRERLSI